MNQDDFSKQLRHLASLKQFDRLTNKQNRAKTILWLSCKDYGGGKVCRFSHWNGI